MSTYENDDAIKRRMKKLDAAKPKAPKVDVEPPLPDDQTDVPADVNAKY